MTDGRQVPRRAVPAPRAEGNASARGNAPPGPVRQERLHELRRAGTHGAVGRCAHAHPAPPPGQDHLRTVGRGQWCGCLPRALRAGLRGGDDQAHLRGRLGAPRARPAHPQHHLLRAPPPGRPGVARRGGRVLRAAPSRPHPVGGADRSRRRGRGAGAGTGGVDPGRHLRRRTRRPSALRPPGGLQRLDDRGHRRGQHRRGGGRAVGS